MHKLSPPTSEEYAEFYAGYVQRAQAKGDVLAALSNQIDEIYSALGNLEDEEGLFRDAPQEWSIKEVIGHLNDGERVFSYRLLRVSRNDKTPIPGFEQNDYTREAGFDHHPLKDLIQEFEYLRGVNVRIPESSLSEDGDRTRLRARSHFVQSLESEFCHCVRHAATGTKRRVPRH